ncbi:estradiol 17-beta-dehydrogenase 11 [Megalopta genalis]|uniref:estradiol 17-beta-dehydrogenase 11 n=1 Tax=Megalopta genalis TaxID=115081 RepID=UPI00144318AB|nr:estradiol 17-beta-dehydrogenase 11-like [Megalopta genalis]XP_033334520.1 estradiol 17-beta-dehydrogenase 11-like [Megalopta genalis]XP_033334521.1 estradiol 17-beta-dehydrogenase 11-like [Megalopta genalis]
MALPEWAILTYDLLQFAGMTIVYIIEAILLTFVPRRFRAKSVKGEVALITGGAGGVGSLIAKNLAKLGAHVVIWDINTSAMNDTVREIREAGGKCWGYHCDIADREVVYKTAKTVQVEVGSVTLLVNNAGYVWGKTLLNLPDQEIERTYRINILAHYWITKAFLKDMMKNNYGHIVTIASVAGLLGTYRCTDYSATKFAAIGYHESLYTELKVHGYDGIHATLVCPSYINTGMFEGVKPRITQMLEPEYVAEKVVSGILVNQTVVVIPEAVRFLLPLKFLLPAKSCWALMYNILGGPQSMMTMKEKGRQEITKNNNNNMIISNGACIK